MNEHISILNRAEINEKYSRCSVVGCTEKSG